MEDAIEGNIDAIYGQEQRKKIQEFWEQNKHWLISKTPAYIFGYAYGIGWLDAKGPNKESGN